MSRPSPDVALVYSDVHVLAYALMRWLLRARTRIVLVGFIYTERKSRMATALRQRYFRFVLSRTAAVICHSRLEVQRYSKLFRRQFVFVPWGTNVRTREHIRAELPVSNQRFAVSAGRSGRDYKTLCEAFDGFPLALEIICDNRALLPRNLPPNVSLLSNCYDEAYLQKLVKAELVIIPLAIDDISAGQMVLLQAMALGKAVVVTQTPSITEYVSDGVEVLTVTPHDIASLRSAVFRLLEDPDLRTRMGAAAADAFARRYSMEAYIRSIVGVAQAHAANSPHTHAIAK